MNRLRTSARAAVVVAVLILAAACGGGGGSSSSSSEKLVVGSLLSPSSLDPTQVTGGSDHFFLRMVYDRLLETDPESGEVVAGLATEWGYSEDKMSFDMTLREGVEFSDGTPVDAEAVKANLERNFELTKLGQITSVESVEVVSPTEVSLKMKDESAWIAEQLASNSGFMVSPKAFEANDDVSGAPVGSGPYVIKSNVPGSQITYEKNPDYWNDDRGFYETIDLKFFKNAVSMNQALQSGSIQVGARTALTDVDTLKKDDNLEVEVHPSLAHYHVQFNTVKPAMEDPRVRRAFNFALDREALAEPATDGLGEATQSLFPPAFEYSTDALQSAFDHDPDQARDLLADAGQEDLELECVTYTGSGYETSAPYIIEQLEEVGITVNLEVTELSEAMGAFYSGDDTAKAAKGPDCYFTSWPGQPSVRDTINAEYGKTIYNNGHYETVDFGLLEELETAYELEDRKALVEEIELESYEDPVMANMYTKPKAFTHAKSVTGHEPNLLEFDIDMAALRPAE
ncbi:ABC transporter substrate-binding protein [Aeromicrobium sp. CTD01-1L150]|uniref:ABC transporter substrate-binding protein n=1 Tax=Aeromicrobium sp. CTD01-1L150 TaxID=3341830 RepID=UPI0035BEC797